MLFAGNYVGDRIYIYDENNNKIAQTSVAEHNKEYMVIYVNALIPGAEKNALVKVLILTNNGVHEYNGRTRKTLRNPLFTEIALFHGKVLENRSATRFTVNTEAIVSDFLQNGKRYPLPNKLKVHVVNLSTSGALLRARPELFDINTIVELKMDMGGKITTIYSEIMRIKPIDDEECEYGCKFVAMF